MRNPEEILEAARSKWPTVLRAEAAGESVFPLIIPFGRPSTTSDLGGIRAELASFADLPWKDTSIRIECRAFSAWDFNCPLDC